MSNSIAVKKCFERIRFLGASKSETPQFPVDICRYAYIVIQPDYDKVLRAEAGGITASTFPWG